MYITLLLVRWANMLQDLIFCLNMAADAGLYLVVTYDQMSNLLLSLYDISY